MVGRRIINHASVDIPAFKDKDFFNSVFRKCLLRLAPVCAIEGLENLKVISNLC